MDETALTYFTPRAQQALANAWKEADWFYHDFVGTEHLLLGLLELGQGLAFRILMNSGLTSEGVRLEVARLVGKSAAEVSAGNIPYTPNATQALQLAIEEARTPNHEYVGTEHVLLGLLRVEPSTSSKLFEHCGMDVGKTADEVRLQVRVKISALRDEDELRDRNDFTHHDFSPRAWSALEQSGSAARRMSQHFVGTEHLLLGMISVGKGRGVEVLQKLGLNLEAIRDEIEVAVGTGPSAIPPGRVPYTPRSRKVLELAAKEAKMLAKSYMGTEHILLGLLHENQGVAGRVLNQHGISLDQVRQEIHKMDDGRGADADDKP